MNVFTRKLTAALPATLLCVSLSGVTTMSYADTSNPNSPVSMVEKWDKTFAESDKVDHRKVAFQNRYRIILVGDLYIPKNRGERKLAAIALSGPFGAVKSNQAACMHRPRPNRDLLRWHSILLTRVKVVAIRVMSPLRISTLRTLARRLISLDYKRGGSPSYWITRYLRLGRHGTQCGGDGYA